MRGRADLAVMAPPFDFDEVKRSCLGDGGFAGSLIECFQRDSETHLKRLLELISRGDLTAASAVAHSLKGSAAVTAASRVRRVAAMIESAGEQGRLEDVRRLLGALEHEIVSCRDYLPHVREIAGRAE